MESALGTVPGTFSSYYYFHYCYCYYLEYLLFLLMQGPFPVAPLLPILRDLSYGICFCSQISYEPPSSEV